MEQAGFVGQLHLPLALAGQRQVGAFHRFAGRKWSGRVGRCHAAA
jgi:hypothetical protein